MKPISSRYGPKRWIVSGAKLDIESGTAIGLAPDQCAHRLRVETGRDLVEDPFRLVVRERFQELGAADPRRWQRDAAALARKPPRARSSAFRSIGVMPATGSFANCHAYASAPITLPSM